jgi:hypothetical protein
MCAVFRNLAETYTTVRGTRPANTAGHQTNDPRANTSAAEVTPGNQQAGPQTGLEAIRLWTRHTGASPTQGRRAVYSNLLKTGKFASRRALKSARSIAALSS